MSNATKEIIRTPLMVQCKALRQLVRNGEAERKTFQMEVCTGSGKHYKKELKDVTIYKLNEMYRAPQALIEKHRKFLLKKYNGVIPYNYDK